MPTVFAPGSIDGAASPAAGLWTLAHDASPAGWSASRDLGASGNEARLGPDYRTLYFSAADRRVHRISLAPWLLPRPAR